MGRNIKQKCIHDWRLHHEELRVHLPTAVFVLVRADVRAAMSWKLSRVKLRDVVIGPGLSVVNQCLLALCSIVVRVEWRVYQWLLLCLLLFQSRVV